MEETAVTRVSDRLSNGLVRTSSIGLKIGIGRNPSMASEEYVLKRFKKEELETLNEAIDTAADALNTFIREGSAKAMSLFNKRGQE